MVGNADQGLRGTSEQARRVTGASFRPLRYVTVQQNLVAELRVGTAGGRGRHQRPLRYLRIRDDLTPGDIAAEG